MYSDMRSNWKLLAFCAGIAFGVAQPSMAEGVKKGPRLDPTITSATTAPIFGIYDPSGTFGDDKTVGIEHLFLPWQDVDLSTLKQAEAYAQQRGRTLMITVEPWTWSKDQRVSPEKLRNDILAGRHDSEMSAVCSVVGTFKIPVTIRWGHEMEDKSGQFTWANWKAEDYVKAYRHVVDVCRKVATNVKFMWSPLGEEGLKAYYPGGDYVDVIGISVFALQQYDREHAGRDRAFAELIEPKYARVKQFNKPVTVAEFGCSGDVTYVQQCLDDSRRANVNTPNVNAVVYFNDKEVYRWPGKYGLPDWRLDRSLTN